MSDWYSDPNDALEKKWHGQDLGEMQRKLITANHILHNHGVVDAYGHISIRHPQDPMAYIMSGYMAPALVKSSEDLIVYRVEGSDPTDPDARKGYSERFIHGEIYRIYPNVNCVVHSHAEDVLPYVTGGVPLKPVFHMAGFLGDDAPVFDIAELYEAGEQQDLLVRNVKFGTALSRAFSINREVPSARPDHSVVLMRRHGFTTHGQDIETAVYRAIYTKINAKAQTTAMLTRAAFVNTLGARTSGGGPGAEAKFPIETLTEEMCAGCGKMNTGTQDKPWRLWEEEVGNNSLYVNNEK